MRYKWLISAYALGCILFFQYGFNQWVASNHSVQDIWRALQQDWLLLITFVDAGHFSLLVLGWLVLDLRRQTFGRIEKVGWFALTIWLGAPIVLLYLAWRRRGSLLA
jgi:hypothetical protein